MTLGQQVKKWKPGVADADWKVAISERDIANAERGIGFIADVLGFDPGGPIENYVEAQVAFIGQFSGAQIAKALNDYRQSAQLSIAKGKTNVQA